jgi:hypothetical protein
MPVQISSHNSGDNARHAAGASGGGPKGPDNVSLNLSVGPEFALFRPDAIVELNEEAVALMEAVEQEQDLDRKNALLDRWSELNKQIEQFQVS